MPISPNHLNRIWLDANGRPVRTKPVWTIYQITDPAGKAYVGCTRELVADRWDALSSYSGYNRTLRAAVKQLGRNAFSFAILAEALTVEDAVAKEERYIAERSTLRPAGYNWRATSALRAEIRYATPAQIARG